MESVIIFDRELFQFLNSFHNDFFDTIMYWISYKFTWIPLYALLIFWIIKHYKKQSIVILITVGILITAADQGCNYFKHSIKRPRPCREEASLTPAARTLDDYHCSRYGFFSAHAANSVALAVFMTALLSPFFRRIGWFLFPWAIITAYSRIYLGVHYPMDILCGGIYGFLIARILLKALNLYWNKTSSEKA